MSTRSALPYVLALLASTAASAQGGQAAAVEVARQHVVALGGSEGLAAADLADLVETDVTTSPRSGITAVYLRQRAHGLEVLGSERTVAVGQDGRVWRATGRAVPGVGALAPPAPALSPDGAVAAAARAVGAAVPSLASTPFGAGADRAVAYARPETALAPLTARLAYHADSTGALRLVWVVGPIETTDADGPHAWVLRVDAATGAEVARADWVTRCALGPAEGHAHAPGTPHGPVALVDRGTDGPWVLPADASSGEAAGAALGSYRVFSRPAESPNHTAPVGTRALVTNPHHLTASPYGWHDTNGVPGPEAAITSGNNVHAYTDTDDDNLPDAGSSPNGGGTLTFTFPLDLTQAPSTYRPAAVTNLFYWNNVIHDILYQYGFDSPSGNFQVSTYGRGGLGDDYVRAEAQDKAELNPCPAGAQCSNNATFGTPPDGERPRMQMYEWTYTTPRRDSDLDAGVIVHEYVHGLSNRLVGGPANVECLGNREQMGEGWSDWYNLMLTQTAADTRERPRGMATYLRGQTTTGQGIRPAPYSTSFAVNNYTYQDTRTLAVPHGVGFAWATILWEVTWDLIDAHGFSPNVYDAGGTAGNQIALAIVTEAMRYTACSPGFEDARDAVILADAVLYPSGNNPFEGRHYDLLWNAFSRRGLGASASQGSTASTADNNEAFDSPLPVPNVSVLAMTMAVTLGPNQQTTRTLLVRNTAPAGSQELRFRAGVTFASALDGGEPATGGYTWADSNAPVGTPGRPTYAWTDISSTGTRVTGYSSGEATIDFPGGFTFPFYGERTVSSATVTLGGFLTLETRVGNWWYLSTGLPNPALPNAVVAPFWDPDLSGVGGNVYYAYDAAADRLVVQWTDFTRLNENARYTFQALLYRTGRIEFMYHTLDGTRTSATVGVENTAGTQGLQVVRNAAYLTEGLAVRIEPGWLTVSPSYGNVAPGGSALITLSLDGRSVPTGTFTGRVAFSFNDPDTPLRGVPVSMTVEGRSVEIAGNAGWRMLAPPYALTVADLAGQNLVQGVPGYYPGAGSNLYTNYSGTRWVSAAGGGEAVPRGSGLIWYLWEDAHTPGGPSTGVALPMHLTAPGLVLITDVSVPLHRTGDRWNLVGNPFSTGLNLSGLGGWAEGGSLASSVAQVWDPNVGATGSYVLFGGFRSTVAPWQGFFVQNSTATGLTIPSAARTDGGVFNREDDEERRVAFELTGTDPTAPDSPPVVDRALAVVFHPEGTAGADLWDASKLAPLSAVHVAAAFAGTDADGAPVWQAQESRALDAPSFEVPLHVVAVGTGPVLTLTWPRIENVPDTWRLVLRDVQTGVEVDLREADRYTFEADPEEGPRDAPERAGRRVPPPSAQSLLRDGEPARFVLAVETDRAVDDEPAAVPPTRWALHPPVPNPAVGGTIVQYDVPRPADVRVDVFDLLGRRVLSLASGPHLAGRHAVRWDAAGAAAGSYFVRMASEDGVSVQRLTVLR